MGDAWSDSVGAAIPGKIVELNPSTVPDCASTNQGLTNQMEFRLHNQHVKYIEISSRLPRGQRGRKHQSWWLSLVSLAEVS